MNENKELPITEVKPEYIIGDRISHRIALMRGILTLMVVNIHSINLVVHFQTGNVSWGNSPWLATIEYLFSEVVSRTAVPAFFFISALLLYKKEFKWIDNLKKKIRSLVIPYIIVNSFWIAVYLILQSIPSLSTYFTMDGYIIRNWDIIGWLKGYGIFSSPLVAPLWFIRDLFVLNVLSKVIKRILNYAPTAFAILLLLFWISPYNTHIFCLNKQALCFWSFGYICVHVFWFVYGTTIQKDSINRLLLLISEYSFGIYLFHQLTLNCINKVYAKLIPPSSISQLFGYLVIPSIVIAGCVLFSIFLKKYAKRLYCVLFGKSFPIQGKLH